MGEESDLAICLIVSAQVPSDRSTFADFATGSEVGLFFGLVVGSGVGDSIGAAVGASVVLGSAEIRSSKLSRSTCFLIPILCV
ncbi:hypothetical protein D3C75_627290 [compost metagenome]